jgi:hypothetical protein
MWEGPWGWPVQWCAFWGSDFCKFCVVVNRAWCILVLHRNPTLIGMHMPPEEEKESPSG